MAKFRGHYPGWSITKSLNDIYNDLAHGVHADTTEAVSA